MSKTKYPQRMEKELEVFLNSFPSVDLDDIPLSVWNKVKNGTALSDAYAEYETEENRKKANAQTANEKNSNTPGAISRSSDIGTLSAKEVAAMTPAQVRANYAKILSSMEAKGFYN